MDKFETPDFIHVFKFFSDSSKPGRIISIAKIGEVYMSRLVIEAGVTTGNIYHRDTSVMFFVEKGDIVAAFEHIESKERKEVAVKEGTHAIHIPSFVAHATKNVGSGDATLIFFTDKRLRSNDDYPYTVL